ncbi:MAG: S8 family serine peptidase [Acidobacteriota bacterium]
MSSAWSYPARVLCFAALFLLGVTAVTPVLAQTQYRLVLLFPRIKTDAASMTAVAIANPTTDSADVLLGLLDNTGQVVDADGFTIPPNTQFARQITELFAGRTEFDGCLVLLSTNMSVVGFFLSYNLDFGNHQIDGAEAVAVDDAMRRNVIFPELPAGSEDFAEISLYAAAQTDVKVNLKLFGGNDEVPLETRQISIPVGQLGGRFTGKVKEIFTVPIPSPAYVMASADTGLIGYEHFGNTRSFGGRNAIAAPSSTRKIPFVLYGAQLAEAYGYTSEITLINPTDESANVKLSAFQFNPVPAPGASQLVASWTETIPAKGMIRKRAASLLGLTSQFIGWLRVDSDIAGVVGDITFGDANSTPPRFLSSVQLQSTPFNDFVFSHLATDDSIGFSTGLTFLNVNSSPAHVVVEVYDVEGNLTGQSAGFVLEPFEHAPRTLGDIIPTIKPQIGGFIRVKSDLDIFSFELFLYAPAGQVLSLSAVPPQRGNGTISGELTPSLAGAAVFPTALKLSRQVPYPASAAKGVRLDAGLDFVPGDMIVRLRPTAAPDALDQITRRHGGRVKVKSPTGVHLLESRQITGGVSLRSAGSPASVLLAAKNSTLQAVEALNLEPDVVYAEPNYISRISADPNDQFYDLQWHYPYIKLPQAWDITTGSPDTIIAVIDTGAKYGHPDLAARLTGEGYDFITDPQISLDGDGPDPDAEDVGDDPNKKTSSYHGTHVAGTIGAATNNTNGLAGVNWSSPLMTLRALGAGGGTSYDISQAILYAAGLANAACAPPTKKASVINMSLSSDGDSLTERNAVQAALGAGVSIVAAAGNQNSSTPRYPAAYPGVIAVGAIDASGNRAPYSNYGLHYVTIVAPGGNSAMDSNNDGYVDGVLSTGWNQDDDQPTYVFKQGTSMATPHVTGIVSLLLAAKPDLSPEQIKQILEQSALDIGEPGEDEYYGFGLVDPVEALKKVMDVIAAPAKLIVSTSKMDFGYIQTEMTATVSNGGGGTLDVYDPAVVLHKGSGWLTVSKSGSVLTVTVNRTGLADGEYTGEIQLESNGGDETIQVVMQVGTPSGIGNLGKVYVLALDPRTLETVRTTEAVDLEEEGKKDGKFEFKFHPMFAGYYFVVAGNDADEDGWIFEDDEYWGLYPVSSEPSLVQVRPNEDSSSIDFVLEKPTTPAAASVIEELRHRTGRRGFPVMESRPAALQLFRNIRENQ